MARLFSAARPGWFGAALALLLAASSVVVVDEGEQVVIERLGQPLRVVNRFTLNGPGGAGVVLKLPFVDHAVHLRRGLAGFAAANQAVRSADGQDLLVDADVTYRIIDPVRFAARLGDGQRLDGELSSLAGAVLGGRLGAVDARTAALPGAGGAAALLRRDLDARTRAFGVQVVDLRIGRVMPGEAALQTVYDTMQTRHLRQVDDIVADQIASAKRTRAEVDAETAAILQASAGRDPEFYDFWRALRSYALVFENPDPKNPPTIVIPPDSAYLRHFNGR